MNEMSNEHTLTDNVHRLMRETGWSDEMARAVLCNWMAKHQCTIGEAVEALLALPELEPVEEDEGYVPLSERSAEERIDVATAALEHMSEEWIQNEFGENQTDAIMDALNDYLERAQREVAE